MSEQVEKKPPIDSGVVAKVVWQANKALHEQLGTHYLPDWDKTTASDRSYFLHCVEEHLKNRSKEGYSQSENAPELLSVITDHLIPSQEPKEKKSPAKKAADKKD